MIDFAIRAGQLCALWQNASLGWEEIAYCRKATEATNPAAWQIVAVQNGADRVKLRRAIAQAYVALKVIKGIIQ